LSHKAKLPAKPNFNLPSPSWPLRQQQQAAPTAIIAAKPSPPAKPSPIAVVSKQRSTTPHGGKMRPPIAARQRITPLNRRQAERQASLAIMATTPTTSDRPHRHRSRQVIPVGQTRSDRRRF